MTFRLPEVKSILKWTVAVGGLAMLIVVGSIAWGLGVRWPTVHRVDQPGIPDVLYLKAVDFLDDSGYVVEVHFETCCTDRMICTGPAGRRFEAIQQQIRPGSPTARISLRWSSPTVCPWRFQYIAIRKNGSSRAADPARFTYGVFQDSEATSDGALDPDCLRFSDPRYLGGAASGVPASDECVENASRRFSFGERDTIRIARESR